MTTRAALASLYERPDWRIAIGVTIFANSIVLGAMAATPKDSKVEAFLEWLDFGLLGLLVLDIALCLFVKRLEVLRSGWDLFDIAVTLISIPPSVGALSTFRVLRAIRVLRLISFLPRARATLDALMGALRNMTAAFAILAVVFYSFVIISTNLFRDLDPIHYGTLERSAAHLYSTMVTLGSTLENETIFSERPWALVLFAGFIVVASFGLLNMFIAVLVSALKEQLDKDHVTEERARLDRLERKIDELFRALARG